MRTAGAILQGLCGLVCLKPVFQTVKKAAT